MSLSPWFFSIPAAFLAGTIPFGLLIGRAKGIDVRSQGSGNIGATNVGRILGKPYFFLCFTLDFLKGFVPVLIAGWSAGLLQHTLSAPQDRWLWVATMLAPVLGHVLNPWLNFKGGKGVATSLGALLAIWPHLTFPAVGVLLVFLVILRAGRIMSLASITAAVSLPLFVLFWWWFANASMSSASIPLAAHAFSDLTPFLAVSTLIAILVVWTHRANIRRLLAGTEPKLGMKPAQSPPK